MAAAVGVSPITGQRIEPLDDLMKELSLDSNVSDAYIHEERSEHLEEEETYVTPYDEAYEWDEGKERIQRKGFHKPNKTYYVETAEENERFQTLINHQHEALRHDPHLDSIKQGLSAYDDLRMLGTDIPYSTTLEISVGRVSEHFYKEIVEEREQRSYLYSLDDAYEEPKESNNEPTVYYLPEVETPKPMEMPLYTCAACAQAIVGRCVTAMMRKFHPEHFVCSYCLKQLNKGSFKESDDKPYCHQCFYRLHG